MARRQLFPATLALLLTAACGSSGGSATGATATQDSTANGGAAVTIQSFSFRPSPLTVAPGATVKVSNRDDTEHTVTSTQSGKFDSGDVGGNESVTFTAPSAPGTYAFMCKYHSTMHGTLIVKG